MKRILPICLIVTLLLMFFGVQVSAATTKVIINDLLVKKASWPKLEDTERTFNKDGSISVKGIEGVAYYKLKYTDAEFRFRAKATFAKSLWVSYIVRAQYNTLTPWHVNNRSYFLLVNENSMELHRFRNGDDVILGTVKTSYFANQKDHELTIGTKDITNGVNLWVLIDDELVLDLEDTDKPIKGAGYFGVMAYQNSINTIMPIPGYVTTATPEDAPKENPNAGGGPLPFALTIAAISLIVFLLPKKHSLALKLIGK